MSLHRTVRIALGAPFLAVLPPYAYSLAVMHSDPGSSLAQRGIPVLGLVAALALLVELAAVPASLWLLASDEDYRTASSILLTAAGVLTILFGSLLALALLFGH